MSRHPRALGALLALAVAPALALAGCSPVAAPAPEPEPSLGTVIFDMGHGEVFGADDASELGQSQAVQRIADGGFDVVVDSDGIGAADLADASGLILAGPMIPLTDDEYAAITTFVEGGGTVLLTIHVPYPVMKVPAHWGLPVGTQIMMCNGPLANPTQRSIFAADQIVAHSITEGVSQVVVVSGWPVSTASESAEIVVATGSDVWLSAAGDQQPVPPEGTQFGSHGVIGIARIGAGQIIVSGDDAVFANLALGEGDNQRLLDNIIRVMTLATEA